jgi:hypothetical protein
MIFKMGSKQDQMRTTVIGVSIAVIAVFATIAAARFIFGGPEDDWICSNGQWVMHGAPSAPKPTTPCR